MCAGESGLKSDIREIFRLKELGRTLAAVVGTLIFALAVNLLIVPAGVYSDGLMGICQVIRTVLARYLRLIFGRTISRGSHTIS
jgi:uncharacterized membrane-anchored protein YitT (DUF2179 family)